MGKQSGRAMMQWTWVAAIADRSTERHSFVSESATHVFLQTRKDYMEECIHDSNDQRELDRTCLYLARACKTWR